MDKPRILVVEDSPDTQATLKGLFTELGCEVTVFATGEVALDRLKQGLEVDVIILDFKLPGMSGPQFYREIALDKRWKDIPVVPFTSQWNEYLQPKLAKQWIAFSLAYAMGMGSKTSAVVPKGESEDVANVPDELVLLVASNLKQQGKELPDVFDKVVRELLKRKKLI